MFAQHFNILIDNRQYFLLFQSKTRTCPCYCYLLCAKKLNRNFIRLNQDLSKTLLLIKIYYLMSIDVEQWQFQLEDLTAEASTISVN